MLGLRPANERRRYKVKPSAIGWVQTWYQLCTHIVTYKHDLNDVINVYVKVSWT